MSNKPFGIDVSRWQGKINWDIIAAHKEPVRFAGIRATISWGYADSWFKRNWQEAKRVGILRMAYHVIYPAQDPKRQMDNLFNTVGSDTGELPLVLDVELDHKQSPDKIQSNILKSAAIIEERTGRKPIIYSRASWVNPFITANRTPPGWLNDYDWWLAHYLRSGSEHPGPPALPKGLVSERLLIHQTSDHGPAIGAESKMMDYNRWQYDEAHLEKYAGVKFGLSYEEKFDLLWKAHPELHPG